MPVRKSLFLAAFAMVVLGCAAAFAATASHAGSTATPKRGGSITIARI